MTEFVYPHPDPNVDSNVLLKEPSHIRLYEFANMDDHWYQEGGHSLTDFVSPPIVHEDLNGAFYVEFDYKLNGNHAEKLDYLKLIVCPVPIYWEELFYIHEIERDLEKIKIVAKHITFLAERIPMREWKRFNATGNDCGWQMGEHLFQNPLNFRFISRFGNESERFDIEVEKNTTVGDFIKDTWIPLWGGQIWRKWKDIRLWKQRGGDTQVQIAKYKNLEDRSWVGNMDDLVTRAHVTAEVKREWLLPAVTGSPLTDKFIKSGQRGKLHVSVRDKANSQLINGKMKFAIYDANGNKVETLETHDTDSIAQQEKNLARWQQDLAKKQSEFPGEWLTEQAQKRDAVIAELQDKIAGVDIGWHGRRIVTSGVPGTYTIVMESAPDGYVEDYVPRRNIVVNTTDDTTIHFYLNHEDVPGATSEITYHKTVDSPLIDEYPIVMDGFFTISDPSITTQEALDSYAPTLFTHEMLDLIMEDFTVTPSDLVNLETFNIGSTALVYLEDRDIDRRVTCVSYEYDALKQEIVSYTFGKQREGIGGVLGRRIRKMVDEAAKEQKRRTDSIARATSTKVHALTNGIQGQLGALGGELDFAVRSLQADVVDANILFASYAEIDEALLKKATIDELYAETARIEALVADSITTEYLFTNYLTANEIQAGYASIENLEAVDARIDTITAGTVTTDYLEANYARIDSLDTTYAKIDDLTTIRADIVTLQVNNAEVSDLLAGNLTAENMQAGFITADSALIANGAITSAMIKEAAITDAHIVSLDAATITSGTIIADRLMIRGSEHSIVYAINNITGALQAENVDTINGEVLTPRTINADKIIAGSITAEEMKAGTITAASGIIHDLNANVITAGYLDVARIESHSITANKLAADVGQSLDLSSNVAITSRVTKEQILTDSEIQDALKGEDGQDLTKSWTHIKFADSGTGANMSDLPGTRSYIGIGMDKPYPTPSTDPLEYYWGTFRNSSYGVPLPSGKYAWVKFADTNTGVGLSNNPTNKRYVGVAIKTSQIESATPTEYEWRPIYDRQLIVQPTAPTNVIDGQLWLDTSAQPAVLRRREGSEWTAVTDLTHIQSILAGKMGEEDVRDMLEALELSLTTTTQSTIDQTASEIALRISQVTTAMDEYGQELNSLGDRMDMVWRITPEGTELGASNNPVKLIQKPDRISFVENGREVAYFSNWQLYVTSIHVSSEGTFQHGSLAWGYSSNGNYELRQVGA